MHVFFLPSSSLVLLMESRTFHLCPPLIYMKISFLNMTFFHACDYFLYCLLKIFYLWYITWWCYEIFLYGKMVIMVKQIHICIKSKHSETGLSRVSQSVGGEVEGVQNQKASVREWSLFWDFFSVVLIMWEQLIFSSTLEYELTPQSWVFPLQALSLEESTASWVCVHTKPEQGGARVCRGLLRAE